jgi:hypothetical protein
MDSYTEAEPLHVEHELSACPRCTYSQGFHVAFARQGEHVAMELICPSCAARYRVGQLNQAGQ